MRKKVLKNQVYMYLHGSQIISLQYNRGVTVNAQKGFRFFYSYSGGEKSCKK